MIGIVVVSHSAQVARAAVALASEMVEADRLPTIEVAAGLDESTFGTDAAAIAEALSVAESGDGVLVLVDLGSAIMSAEMAVEFLDPEAAGRVAISSAPLVEGLVAAVVTTAAGASLDGVRAEAERGLMAKQDHLGVGAGAVAAGPGDGDDAQAWDSADAQASDSADARADGNEENHGDVADSGAFPQTARGPVLSRELRVDIAHGLHARPAARLVGCVKRFGSAQVRLRNLDGVDRFVDASSLSAVATLNVREGHRIEVCATGEEAAEALDALAELADADFGDAPQRAASTSDTADEAASPDADVAESGPGGDSGDAAGPAATATAVTAASVGSGLEAAIGPITRPASGASLEDYQSSGEVDIEHSRLSDALATALSELQTLTQATRSSMGEESAQVFEAHQALLDDSALLQPAHAAIDSGDAAAEGWQHAGKSVAGQFEALDDEYQRERAHDVRSVTDRVLRLLVEASAGSDQETDPDHAERGEAHTADGLSGEVQGADSTLAGVPGEALVLVVPELDPGTAATLDADHVAGILCTAGGATSHGVIIASTRGIPVMTGVTEVAEMTEGTTVAFDSRHGTLLIRPSPSQQTDFDQMLQDRSAQQSEDRAAATEPGRTSDGHPVAVLANVTSADQAYQAVELGAQGSGLVRTEALFESWDSIPTVAEQAGELVAMAKALDGRPMTIRTWDIGADKPLAFWRQASEQNPFLGVRGLRSFRADPEPLRDQLRAICQVAADHPVSVMFPMVSTVEEVNWALEQLGVVCQELPGGRPAGLRVGIMIEVPAAALRPGAMSAGLDFVSIGTNDLTQYVMAAERGNPGVDDLFDTMDPAVLALIHTVCEGVGEDVDVGVCGAAASDPLAAALLVGLGVHDLSATPVAVPRVKSVLRRNSLQALRNVASSALNCDRAEQVRHVLRTELESN
ncbi:MAG: dihydroxyacetone kinase phosphoryl donor subunit DhaM [Ornithinimicrobium sp.]